MGFDSGMANNIKLKGAPSEFYGLIIYSTISKRVVNIVNRGTTQVGLPDRSY